MQSYLKTKPVFVQLMMFLGVTLGIAAIFGQLALMIIPKLTGITELEMSRADTWNKTNLDAKLAALRGMQLANFIGFFVIPSFLFAYLSDPRPMQYLGLKQPYKVNYWILGIAIMFVSMTLVELSGMLNRQIPFGAENVRWIQSKEEEVMRMIQLMLAKHTIQELILNLVFIALFAGVGEELLFRGVFQRMLIRAFNSPWAGVIVTAALFSAIHMQFFGFIPRLLLGVFLGAVYWYSGSLWVAIAAHFVYDAFIIVLAYFQPHLVSNTEANMFEPSRLTIYALISAVLVGLLLWQMIRQSKANYSEVYKDDKPPVEQDFTF